MARAPSRRFARSQRMTERPANANSFLGVRSGGSERGSRSDRK
jgi:hypothetical protein